MDTAPDEKVPSKFPEMEDLKSKNLYICIDVLRQYPYSSWVVHEIRMNDVLSNSKTLRYKEVANVFGKLPVAVGCGVFTSRILFGGGINQEGNSLIREPNERENEYGWRLPPTRLPNIPVYHMSNDYHSLIHIATVEMPVSDQLAHKFGAPETYSFVNLGGQRVCLALSAVSSTLDGSLGEREKLSILVATFEYKVETSKKRTWESSPVSCSLSYEFLTTPGILEYDIPQHPEISPSHSNVITGLLGAFVL
ncbi:hypothetical protein M0R45_031735 [Rubus argutus]|uniref:Uncharacterized protein n=1 Tax=Rubus argutus TaxID=59490 RepID=A0AAW1WFJ1_RUBAR